MAVVTDILQTVLKIVGGPQYTKALSDAAKQTDALARAEKLREASAGALHTALGDLGVEHALLAGRLLAVGFLVRESIKNFQEDEDAIFRTTILLRNLGNSYPIEKAQAFATALQRTTGIQDDQIISMLGTLKAFGAADTQIEQLGRTILDFSVGRGIPLEEATNAVGHAMIGNTRILKNMGIEFKATGDRVRDITALMKLLAGQTAGAAAARLGTLTGQLDRLKASMSEFFSTVGDKLSTVLVPVLDKLSDLIFLIAQNAPVALGLFGAAVGALLTRSPLGALLGLIGGIGLGFLPSRPNAAAKIGGNKAATEATARETAENTKKIAVGMDGFLRLGFGTGTVGLRAGNTRALRSALKGAF